MSILGVVLPLFLLAATCGATHPIFGTVVEPQDEKAMAVTESYQLPTHVKPTAYDISLTTKIAEEDFTYMGVSTISITLASKNKTIVLHAKDLTIEEDVTLTSVKDKKVVYIAKYITLDKQKDFLFITFEKDVDPGQYDLKLKYTGTLNNELEGFYRSSYLTKDNKRRWLATTQFEPVGARRAFPCWDEPAYKAEFTISIRHSKTYKAISNMLEAKPTVVAGEKDMVETKFPKSPAMSTYLIAFVVSDYKSVATKDGKFRVWTKEHTLEHANYALNIGEEILKKLDEYTGIKYNDQMQKMDQISIPDFRAGAMENWGLVTYKESALLYEKGVTTTNAQQQIAEVISHEFAHQWFGNLVTPEWWKYIWLNEGFATYFQYYTTEEVTEKWRLMEQFVVKVLQGTAFSQDAKKNSRPMNADANTQAEIRGLFDNIAYQKAACVIRMMSHFLTEEVFQNGIKKYLSSNKNKVVDSDQLFDALQEAAVESKDFEKDFKVGKIMNEWVNKGGYPMIYVGLDEKGEKFVINQTQFSMHPTTEETKWWIPINYVKEEDANFKDTKPSHWLSPEDKTIEIKDVKKDKWVIFNTQQTGYYRVNYYPKNWELLTAYLKSENFDKIHPVNRAQLIDDSVNLAKAGHLSYPVALQLMTYLTQETDYIPWVSAFRALSHLDVMLADSQEYPKFLAAVQHQVKALTEEVGYEAKTKEDHVTKLHRVNALAWACKSDLEACNKYVSEKLKNWIDNSEKNKLDVDLRSQILCAGLRKADNKTWENVLTEYHNIEDAALKADVLSALGCSASEDILNNFIDSALTKKNLKDVYSDVLVSVIEGNPKGYELVLNTLTENFRDIQKLEPTDARLRKVITEIGKRITDSDKYMQLGLFVAKNGLSTEVSNDGLRYAMDNIEWASSNKEEIEEWYKINHFTGNSASSTSFAAIFVIVPILIARFL